MKKILLLLYLGFVIVSCGNNDDPKPEPETGLHQGRTVLAFFWANNNLDDYLNTNIKDMVSALLEMKDPATLLVYWDGKDPSGNVPAKVGEYPCIVRYTSDGKGKINGKTQDDFSSYDSPLEWGEVVKEYPDQISTKKEVMITVLSDMVKAYPSTNYGIVFGSHGSGWLPSITGSRSIGQDGALSNTALIPELAEALQAACPQKFDFILFDACMMSCAEVCYELRNSTKYCIASVLDIPAVGYPYEQVLSYLYKSDLQNHFPQLCQEYINYYNGNSWGTIAVVDCTQMQGLADATREVIVAHQDKLKDVDTDRLQEYGRVSSNFRGFAYDMVQFVETLGGGEAPSAFMEQFDKAVLYADYTRNIASNASIYKIDGANYCGLGMYIPNALTTPKYTLWNEYFVSSIAWYEAAGWKETQSVWGY